MPEVPRPQLSRISRVGTETIFSDPIDQIVLAIVSRAVTGLWRPKRTPPVCSLRMITFVRSRRWRTGTDWQNETEGRNGHDRSCSGE